MIHCLGDVDRLASPPFVHIHKLPNESCHPQSGVGIFQIDQIPIFTGMFLDVNTKCKATDILKY
jgi:hypothetical protein